MERDKYIEGSPTPATDDTLQPVDRGIVDGNAADSRVAHSAVDSGPIDTLQHLQAKLTKLQAKLHKEFRWYCDTILQGGSLAVRVAYRVHIATEVLSMVDRGEVRDDPALGDYCILIGWSQYCEEDIDRLLAVEYLLDDLYDTWCKMDRTDEEWSDTVDKYLDNIHTDT